MFSRLGRQVFRNSRGLSWRGLVPALALLTTLWGLSITSVFDKCLQVRDPLKVRRSEEGASTTSSVSPDSPRSFTLPLIDVVLFNDELPMLKYRLRLHKHFVSRFVIVESNLTFTGRPKLLHARKYAEAGGFEGYDVLALQVPYTQSEAQSDDPWVRELATRSFVTKWIRDHLPASTVALSDVDELFDAEALGKMLRDPVVRKLECFLVPMRFLYYSEACPISRGRWGSSVVFRTGGTWFDEVYKRGEGVRPSSAGTSPFVTSTCPLMNYSFPNAGWHVSYAMETDAILDKLRSFSEHSHFVDDILRSDDPAALIESRIRRCADIYGRVEYPPLFCEDIDARVFDFKVPPLDGLPRHPLAPTMSDWTSCSNATRWSV